MSQQLTLDLQPRRAPARQLPVIQRLRAVLKRMGIDWGYRQTRGSVLLRPLLVARFGWQSMCGRYCCGDRTFERVAGYFDREPLSYEERAAWGSWREQVYRPSVHALWGPPC